MTKHRATRVVCLLLSASLLSACAVNPLVRWEQPPATQPTQKMTLDEAKRFTALARAAYQQKIYQQVGTTTDLSSGLITLGGIVAALAAGKVHRDVIVGTTLLGGTALALGTWNLDKRRLQIYQGAVAGFNCAERAVSPLNMSEAELAALGSELDVLSNAIAQANVDAGKTETNLDAWVAATPSADKATVQQYRLAITSAEQALAAAAQTQASGYALGYQARRAGDRLIEAVRKIDQEADVALMDTVGDLNKVPVVIASLSGLAGSIAPGSNVEELLGDALKNSVPGTKDAKADTAHAQGLAEMTPRASLDSAAADLERSMRAVAVAAAKVHAHVGAYTTALQSDTLSDCGIGTINMAMTLDMPRLVVAPQTAATATIQIRGGKPPYAVHQQGADVEGITVKGPDRLASNFDVKVAGSIADGTVAKYSVVDSSDPAKSTSFTVQVKTAPAPGAKKQDAKAPAKKKDKKAKTQDPAEPKTSDAAPDPNALKVLQGVKSFDSDGVKFGVMPTPMGGKFTVAVSCAPAPAQCVTQDAMRAKYLKAFDGKADAMGPSITFQNAAGKCVCQ